jgi:hypothetical protein
LAELPEPATASRPDYQVKLAAGTGVLWSVGPDKADNGGTYGLSMKGSPSSPAGDLIFVIPRPEKKR